MDEESKPGRTITVEVPPNVATQNEVIELAGNVGQTVQTWQERIKERAAANAAAVSTPLGAGRS